MKPLTVGLLPLYLKLYDDTMPEYHPAMERFRDTIAGELRQRGLRVAVAPVCRLAPEVELAVHDLAAAGVDALVTLHLAYSPSEESAPILARSPLPLIVLDTTPALDFGPQQDGAEIMYNHGIHGVQDLCNLLLRHGKPFWIEAGHWQASDVLDRVARRAQSAGLASAMRSARVGRIGQPFKGMADFAVPAEVMRATLGLQVVPCEPADLAALAAGVSDAAVEADIAADRAAFDGDGAGLEAHQRTARLGLAVRQWVERDRLTAFTVNFMDVGRSAGVRAMPFLEAGKAMARGTGYAGEGDTLTAGLVGALASILGDTSFVEMFCPDWAGGRILLSHMGEMNLSLAAGRPELVEKSFAFIDVDSFVLAYARFRPGPAVLVNLAPGPRDTYSLIAAPVAVEDVPGGDRLAGSIRGWIRPGLPVADFLERYSRAGGTHHCALVYGDALGPIAGFAELMNWRLVVLPG